jgi:hypothetical protein
LAPEFERILQVPEREKWPHLILFQANHGVGTRGLELLLRNEGYSEVEQLRSKLGAATAFQAIFHLGDIEEAPGGFHKPYSINLVEAETLNLTDDILQRAHEYAKTRLAQEAMKGTFPRGRMHSH